MIFLLGSFFIMYGLSIVSYNKGYNRAIEDMQKAPVKQS